MSLPGSNRITDDVANGTAMFLNDKESLIYSRLTLAVTANSQNALHDVSMSHSQNDNKRQS